MSLGLELDGGVNARLGSTDSGLDDDETVGLSYGLGLWFAPSRLLSIGVSYERIGLGSERTPASVDSSLRIDRDLDSLWLTGRAYPVRSDELGVFLALQIGMGWQHMNAHGTVPSGQPSVTPAGLYSCNAGAGPDMALGGGLGLDVDIERNLGFITEVGVTGHRLTSDTVEQCAPGPGSTTSFGAGVGFQYRFDLDPAPTSAARAAPRLGSF
jgi:hypothetical protein